VRDFFFLLVFTCLSLAIPSCPSYQYHDYVWDYQYSSPQRPPDTFIDGCTALNLTDPTICNLQNLTIEQKKQLISDAMIRNNGFPDFQTSNSWNSQLKFTKYAPDNTTYYNADSIRDAWLKIISVSPSVLDNKSSQLWINSSGNVSSKFNFSFVVPKKTFRGDCRTVYKICGYNYSIQNSLNSQLLGNKSTSNFSISAPYNSSELFSSNLTIDSEYLIHHYHLVEHCDEDSCWHTCDYYRTDDKKSHLELRDQKQAYAYSFIDFSSAIIDFSKNGLTSGWFFIVSNSDFNSIRFLLGNSEIKLQAQDYRFKVENAPYNTLQVETTTTQSRLHTSNIAVLTNENLVLNGAQFEDYLKHAEPFLYFILHDLLGLDLSALPIQFQGAKVHFVAPTNSTNCTLIINSHFGSQNYSDFCRNPNQEPTINLSISNSSDNSFTVRAFFYDAITASPLVQKGINFTYGNETVIAETDQDGIAFATFQRTNSNLVKAEFLTDFETKTAYSYIYVQPIFPISQETCVFSLGLLISIAILYQLLRKAIR